MISEYSKIVTQLPFDGIHLDQYGDPKWGFRYPGGEGSVSVDVSQGIVALIDATKGATGKTVIFNDVNGWPLNQTAPTTNDAIYIEVWPPNVTFNHLGDLIDQGRRASGGKPVVLAAYINPDYAPSVLLTDAVIFAKGGSHIELGEGGNLLADPYFPKYKPMSPELSEHLRRFYDVAVRYQDYLYAKDLREWTTVVTVADTRVLTGGYFNGVWPVTRENDRFATLSLVNLNGLEDARWSGARTADPTVLERRQVTVEMAAAPKGLYLIDPDGADQTARPVKFTYGDGKVSFTLDRLAYWSLLVFEK
jgi:dextranase